MLITNQAPPPTVPPTHRTIASQLGDLSFHRVVGAGGKLTGYAGGLARKRFLLDLGADVAGRASRLF